MAGHNLRIASCSARIKGLCATGGGGGSPTLIGPQGAGGEVRRREFVSHHELMRHDFRNPSASACGSRHMEHTQVLHSWRSPSAMAARSSLMALWSRALAKPSCSDRLAG